jgi:phosphohistidine phosphatase SixA
MASIRTRILPALLATVLLCGVRAAAAAPSTCPSDCNGDFEVTVNELVLAVTIALGDAELSVCPLADRDGNGAVEIADLIAAVSAALEGCPAQPSPTETATSTGTVPPVDTATPTATGSQPPTPTATETVEADTPTATATQDESTPTVTGTHSPDTPTATATENESTPTATEVEATPTATEPDTTATEAPATETPTATVSPTPSVGPSGLTAMIDEGEVRLAWTNPPADAGFPNAKLLRRLNAPVAGPNDPEATGVFFGAAASTAHPLTDLLPDVPEDARVYHYAVFACAAEDECSPLGAATTLTPTLVQVLRAGGYVIHWRHAFADVCADLLDTGGTAENPIVPDWWKSCDNNCTSNPATATARQLGPAGRAQAIAIGEAFDILRLPVGRVLSSEFCRNVTSAELMDFGPPIEQTPALTFFVYDESSRCANTYALLDEVPAAGTNTALIGHAGFSPPCPVLSQLAMGEAAIFKPDGSGNTEEITRVTFDEWASLYPPGPSALSAVIDEPHVRIHWTNGPAYPIVRLLRRLGTPVDGPNDPDALVVYAGTGDTVLEPLKNLLPSTPETPRVYFYAVYGCVGDSCEAEGSQTMIEPSLAQALRAGGYVIHWRHASATVCADDLGLGSAATTSVPNWWKSCDATCPAEGTTTATARQLSDAGRNEATSIGDEFAAEGFPIGRVVSSEFCRNVETAELMDFGPPIEQSQAITYFVYDEPNRCLASFALLAEPPVGATNTALIGHAGNTCPPLSDLAWGEGAIYKPDGHGDSMFIGRVLWHQWDDLE